MGLIPRIFNNFKELQLLRLNTNKNNHRFKLRIASFLLFLSTIMFATVTRAEAILPKNDVERPRYAAGVTSIIRSHHYIQQNKALLYWHISPYYLSQLTDSSCSLASATMMINAIKSQKKLTANDELVTQDELLNKVNNNEWRIGVKQGGNGVTLDELKKFMEKTLQAYGIKGATVEAIHLKEHSKQDELALKQILVESERTAKTLVIANFNQKFFTGGVSVGHFSPIGAYDPSTKRALIMDTDRQFYEPYWVPEKLLFDSMSTPDPDSGHHRGYLVIRLHFLE